MARLNRDNNGFKERDSQLHFVPRHTVLLSIYICYMLEDDGPQALRNARRKEVVLMNSTSCSRASAATDQKAAS